MTVKIHLTVAEATGIVNSLLSSDILTSLKNEGLVKNKKKFLSVGDAVLVALGQTKIHKFRGGQIKINKTDITIDVDIDLLPLVSIIQGLATKKGTRASKLAVMQVFKSKQRRANLKRLVEVLDTFECDLEIALLLNELEA